MRKLFFLLLLAGLSFAGCQNNGGTTKALITTNLGEIEVKLYNDTPKHKENFIKLVEESYYDGTLFHRVISNFMIQGGDPTSIGAGPNVPLGGGGPGYMIDQEIGAPHLRGALAAARTSNPAKASSGSQFYIVTGEKQSDSTLDLYERRKGMQYNDAQRAAYKEIGGRPDLDLDYTVFGEVTRGMDVVQAIADSPKGRGDRPTTDVVIESIRLVD